MIVVDMVSVILLLEYVNVISCMKEVIVQLKQNQSVNKTVMEMENVKMVMFVHVNKDLLEKHV
jgi:hypothetical protein